MSKYLAFAKLGFRQALAEPGELLGRALFFVLILGVFSSVWRAVAESGAVTGRQPAEMLWYLAVTEWVLMSAPLVQFQMEEDIHRGDVAYQITRPASWLGARLSHGLGALAVRAPLLLVVAFAAAWSVAGPPARPAGLGVAIAIGFGRVDGRDPVSRRDRRRRVLARRRCARVLDLAKAAVRARRTAASAAVLSRSVRSRRATHAVSRAARRTGVVRDAANR